MQKSKRLELWPIKLEMRQKPRPKNLEMLPKKDKRRNKMLLRRPNLNLMKLSIKPSLID